jgi:hypothetical protein
MMANMVDLPQPLGPSRATDSPRPTEKVISWSTRLFPNDLFIPMSERPVMEIFLLSDYDGYSKLASVKR